MSDKFKTYTVQAQVKLPKVPNFLIMTDGQSISIADVESNALRRLGEAWTEALVERALEIRRQRETDVNGGTVK